ncbi:MAG: diversity-generating retroelement protein Avd [Deltaproteobacteria bacterium]|nr:diversity-generating retroelement protein Avd [Deltaproteobacteria bacterium]
MKESPIFIKTYETLVWLLHHTQKFPRSQRFVMGKRMEEAALDLYDKLLAAAMARDTRQSLAGADFDLARLKLYSRLAKDLELSAFNQYEFLAKNLDELGKLLGGWRKRAERSFPSKEG